MSGIIKSSTLSIQKQVTTKIICKESQWDAIQVEWNDLFDKSPYSSPPLHFDWLRSWWRIYGPKYGAGGLQIITVWNESQLIGVLPLYICLGKCGLRTLRFISTGEEEYEETCPDYMNILCMFEDEIIVATTVWNEMSKIRWDHLELLDIPPDSPLFHVQAVQTFSRGTCAVANLTDGFEAYVGRLKTSTRSRTRQILKEAKLDSVKFEVIEPSGINRAFDNLMKLHQDRWIEAGKTGVFAAPRFVDFHYNLLKDWVPVGRAVLAQLTVANEPIAVFYAFINNNKCDFYQCGINRDSTTVKNPGKLGHLLLKKSVSEIGVTEFDFLRGSSFHKQQFATGEKELVGLRIWRRTPRTYVYHLLKFTSKIIARSVKLLKIH